MSSIRAILKYDWMDSNINRLQRELDEENFLSSLYVEYKYKGFMKSQLWIDSNSINSGRCESLEKVLRRLIAKYPPRECNLQVEP